MELTNGNYWDEYSEIKNDQQAERELPKGMNQKYYLTTWNNTAMIQTGHSSGASTEDERKVLANTLFYLKQLTKKTEVLDNSARDIADPNKVEGISTIVNENNNTSVKFRRPEDNGSTYEYYVKGLDGDREFTSDTKSATITTGVKKYKYIVDENPANPEHGALLESGRDYESKGDTEDIDIGSITYNDNRPKYIHICAIDGARKCIRNIYTKVRTYKSRIRSNKRCSKP